MSLRRFLAIVATGAVLTSTALFGAGCGSVTVAGHRINLLRSSLCAFSVWRAHHDFKNRHAIAGAFQVYLAAHNCPRAVH